MGELYLYTPYMTKEYVNNLEATASLFDEDGWMRSGDLVKYDDDEKLFYVDRIKDIIRVVYDKSTSIQVGCKASIFCDCVCFCTDKI